MIRKHFIIIIFVLLFFTIACTKKVVYIPYESDEEEIIANDTQIDGKVKTNTNERIPPLENKTPQERDMPLPYREREQFYRGLTLEDYPKPFVVNSGINNAVILLGSNAPATDTLAATDIALSITRLTGEEIHVTTEDRFAAFQDYNLILVGNPCHHDLMDSLGSASCRNWALREGQAMINLRPHGERYAIIVSGTTADDIAYAADVLADYANYDLEGTLEIFETDEPLSGQSSGDGHCVDACNSDTCRGLDRHVCRRGNSGCNELFNNGKTVGYCGVECTRNSHCTGTDQCLNYVCRTPSCGDGICEFEENTYNCPADCGSGGGSGLALYPWIFENGVTLVIGSTAPAADTLTSITITQDLEQTWGDPIYNFNSLLDTELTSITENTIMMSSIDAQGNCYNTAIAQLAGFDCSAINLNSNQGYATVVSAQGHTIFILIGEGTGIRTISQALISGLTGSEVYT